MGTMVSTLGNLNPFRYRGYVYDEETGLYYVASRYYDPEIGRWINADTTDVLSLPYYHSGHEKSTKAAVDGFADGFMTGGIMAGGSQILSSGFKVAANAGVPTGRNGGLTIGDRVRVLSPNHPQAYEAGGTLLKIGSKYRNIRFDVGSNSMFHMNIQLAKTANYHLPIGMVGAGLWGGIACD